MPATYPLPAPPGVAPTVVWVLNGTSSAGKSSLAHALQQRLPFPSLHVQLDTFVDMFGWTAPPFADPVTRRACHAAGVAHFHHALATFARGAFALIVDHLFLQPHWITATREALALRRVHWIRVGCPIPAVETRERARRNRRLGLATSQADQVHANLDYDFAVDTSLAPPEDCAEQVLAFASRATATP